MLALFGGCSNNKTDSEQSFHVHKYAVKYTEATLTEQGYNTYTCSCGETYTEYYGFTGEKQENMNGYSVLFIGNSYTFWHNLPSLFENVVKSAGLEVTVDSVTHGSYSLIKYCNENDTTVDDQGEGNGKMVAEKLKNNSYDIVFLQDLSTQTMYGREAFYKGAYLLNEKVKANGAKSILYQTWARKPGATIYNDSFTVDDMTKTIAANYNVMGEVLNVPVSPVGAAFYECLNQYEEIELYSKDMSHPSINGHYLAALVHFATVYGLSPMGISYRPGGVDIVTASKLQEIAHYTVFDGFKIEDEYLVDKKEVEDFLKEEVIGK